jgi:hypothetical protein
MDDTISFHFALPFCPLDFNVERSLSSGKVEGTKQPVTQDKEF